MPGGPICCLLGACCPPGAQKLALMDHMVAGGMERRHAEHAAELLADALRLATKKLGVAMTNQEDVE